MRYIVVYTYPIINYGVNTYSPILYYYDIYQHCMFNAALDMRYLYMLVMYHVISNVTAVNTQHHYDTYE